jgi:hypothetical protein
MRKIIAALLLAAGLLAGTASAAYASPGPGNSNQCAPGQHAGPTSPGSCDNK